MGRKKDGFIEDAIERDDLIELKSVMSNYKIGFEYTTESYYDLLELSIESKAYDCIKYCIKHMEIKYCHIQQAFFTGNKYLKLILEKADLSQYSKVKFLQEALEKDRTGLFMGIAENISVDLSKEAYDMILNAFKCKNNIEVLKFLFKRQSITAYDYVMAGLHKYHVWLQAFDYLLRNGHKMNDSYSYIRNGKTVYTAFASKGTKEFNSEYLTEIYFKFLEYGYDVLEKEKCEPFRPGYLTIPIRCNNKLWDKIIELAGPQMLVRKFILANNSAKMSYLLKKGINKDYQVGNFSMWLFAIRNNCFNSAVAIYRNNPEINIRVYINGVPLLKIMKEKKADFALKFFIEHSLGFGIDDFNEKNDFCLDYFSYAIEAKINFDLLLNHDDTQVMILILSIINCKHVEEHGTKTLDVMRVIMKEAKDIDFAELEDGEELGIISMLLSTENKNLMTTEIFSYLVENGAKIHFEDVALLVSKPTVYYEILEYIVSKDYSLKEADDDLNIIEIALKTNKPPNFIELILRMNPKYEGDLNLVSWITGNNSYEIIEELIDVIIMHKLDLSKFDMEQKYFHCLMTTAKQTPLSVDVLEKLKKTGANPKNNPSLSILFQKYEKSNPNATVLEPILKFFVDNQVDISEDDKKNCYLDMIFAQDDARLRKLAIIKLLVSIGAKADSSTENSILMRMLKMNIFAPEYYITMFEAGCNVNSVNTNGETFLTRIMKVMGISKRRTELIKIFMEHGADPSIKDKNRANARSLANYDQDRKVIELMKK